MVRPFELHGESVTPGLPPYVSRVADVQNDLGRGVDGNEFAVKVAGRSVDGCTITTQSSAKFFETNAICACGIVVSSTEDIGEEPGTRGICTPSKNISLGLSRLDGTMILRLVCK